MDTSTGYETIAAWIELLRPIDPVTHGILAELAPGSSEQEAWELLLAESGQLLRDQNCPATAAVVAAAMHRASGFGISDVLNFWEQACADAFRPPPVGSEVDGNWLRQTHRAAMALHGLASHLATEEIVGDERFAYLLGGLELLARAHDCRFNFGHVLPGLAERLQGEYPRMARELMGFLSGTSAALHAQPVDESQRDGWNEQLARLCSEIRDGIILCKTRGLTLLNRIQSDNNRRVFRPAVEALESMDRLPQDLVSRIRSYSAKELLDRHPLQTGSGGSRKIEGTARKDTIQHYEELLEKFRVALDLRLKIEGSRPLLGSADDELNRELARFTETWTQRGVRAGNWLFVRLLYSDILLVKSRLPIPDASVLQHAHNVGILPSTLFALIEPFSFAQMPGHVSRLDGSPAKVAALLEAIPGQPESLGKDQLAEELQHLAEQGQVVVGRLWATVSEMLFPDCLGLKHTFDESLSQQRKKLLALACAVQAAAVPGPGPEAEEFQKELGKIRTLLDQDFRQEARHVLEALCREWGLDAEQLLSQALEAQELKAVGFEETPEPFGATLAASQATEQARPDATATQPAFSESPSSPPWSFPDVGSVHGQNAQLQAMFEQAEMLRIANRLDAAKSAFEKILRDAPAYHRARSQLVLVLDKQGERDQAIDLLKDGIKNARSHLPFLHQIVPLLALQAKLDEARDYAEHGIEVSRAHEDEVGFLNDLIRIEQQSGNTEAARDYLKRILRVAQHPDHYLNAFNDLLQTDSRPSAGVVSRPSIIERLPWEIPPARLEISEFLAADFQAPHTLIAPDFVEIKGADASIEEALKLFDKFASNPDIAKPGAEAEALRTSTKLLMEVHERFPDFSFAQQSFQTRINLKNNLTPTKAYEAVMRKWISFYAGRKGDDFFQKQQKDPARAYYLEHFRVFARLFTFSMYTTDRYIRTSIPELHDVYSVGKQYLNQHYRTKDRPRHAPEAVLAMFCTTIDHLIGEGRPDQRLEQFLFDFLDVCLCNEAANMAMDRLVKDPNRFVFKTILRLRDLSLLNIESSTPAEWISRALQKRNEHNVTSEMSLRYAWEELLPIKQYYQAIELLNQVAGQGCSATDQSLIARIVELLRLAERFEQARDFGDKRYLFSNISLQAREVQDLIIKTPTAQGRVYLDPIVFRLQRDQEATFERFKDRHPAIIEVRCVKSSWVDQAIRAEISVENLGLAPAESISLFFTAGSGQDRIAEIKLPRLKPGPYHAEVQKIDVRLAPVPEEEAVEILARGTYLDTEGRAQEITPQCLRMSIAADQTYVSIDNPYVTGVIIKDSKLFKGRDRLVDAILEEVANPSSTGSVVIYGQKRSGKSSILHWLTIRAPQWLVPIPLPVQDMFTDEAVLVNLLLLIAENIVDEAKKQRDIRLNPIDEDQLFNSKTPSRVFRKYLSQVVEALGPDSRLLLLFDEFTDLTDRIERGDIDPGFMRFFKSLNESGLFSCVICGIDSMPQVLKRFSNDFAIANPRMISYLDEASAKELIEAPIRLPDGSSRFNQGAIERILQLTAGSPYFIQLVCSRLVEYLNREQNPDPRVTTADVNETVRDLIEGRAKLNPWTTFDGLCRYKEDMERDTSSAVLEGFALYALADGMRSADYVGHDTLVNRMRQLASSYDQIELVLNDLLDRETLEVPRGSTVRQYRIKVGLFSEWLTVNRPLDRQAIAGFESRLQRAAARSAH